MSEKVMRPFKSAQEFLPFWRQLILDKKAMPRDRYCSAVAFDDIGVWLVAPEGLCWFDWDSVCKGFVFAQSRDPVGMPQQGQGTEDVFDDGADQKLGERQASDVSTTSAASGASRADPVPRA